MAGPKGGDRNAAAKAEFNTAQANKAQRAELAQFQADLAAGRTGLPDRLGQPVVAGDLVVWKPPTTHDLVWEVVELLPATGLDPRYPVGTLQIKLTCTVPIQFLAGQRVLAMIKIGRQATPTADRTVGGLVMPAGVENGRPSEHPVTPQPEMTGVREPRQGLETGVDESVGEAAVDPGGLPDDPRGKPTDDPTKTED